MATNMDRCISAWRELGLPVLQQRLDQSAEMIDRRVTESEQRRKQLIASVKRARGSFDDETRKLVGPVMKLLQGEVDELTKRCKEAEAAFLRVYKDLSSAPDPVPVLERAAASEQSLNQSKDLAVENARLQKVIEEYRVEFSEMKNQEVTIKALKDKIREHEENLQRKVQERMEELSEELGAQAEEKQRSMQQEAARLAAVVKEKDSELSTLRSALDSTQSELLDARTRYEQEREAMGHASEMLSSDLEDAQQQIEQLERELALERERHTQLLRDDASFSASERSVTESTVESLNRELEAKERELAHLITQNSELHEQLNKIQESSNAALEASQQELEEAKTQIMELKAQLTSQSDYNEIKRELMVFKEVEIGVSEKSDEQQKRSLESLLLEKNRALDSQNTSLRNQLAGATRKLKELLAARDMTQSLVEEHSEMISKLENELSGVSAIGAAGAEAGSGRQSLPEELLSNAAPGQQAADTILPIVTSQRDRFKERNVALEAECRHQQETIRKLRDQVDELRSDNVKLYEKIKYIQTYPTTSSASKSEDVESRYSHHYESKLDPFNSFSARERERRYQEMTPADKLMLSFSKIILSNRLGRLFFLIYALVLHLLIFAVLYKVSHATGQHASFAEQCHQQFARHMHDVHHEDIQIPGVEGGSDT